MSRAHPRSRGENHGVQSRITNQTGSSPLTRGKPPSEKRAVTRVGLIPAHAGKTRRRRPTSSRRSAHPRSRGENSSEAGDEKGSTGSSPLTRGKRSEGLGGDHRGGLIPAHAGKTRPCPQAWRWSGAHPRSRGENRERTAARLDELGSSPLTRGKRALDDGPIQVARLIPAHAGKTLQPTASN